ncbi:MAG: hypothetical protein JW844_02470 [Candidatus Omnitrophica bacterium]|nr:hypothetical protein [Candidatus Omnitrophota bacterium]
MRRSSPQKAKRPQVKKEHSLQHIGDVIHFFPKVKAGVIRLRRGSLQIGDTICCKGATTDFRQKVSSMEIDHKPIDTAKKGQEIGILLKKRVRIGDKVYK